jgi:uncharacterized membrane protein
MWTREMIKSRAKEYLFNIYWQAFFVSLIILLVGGGHNTGGSNGSSVRNSNIGFEFDFGSFLRISGIVLFFVIIRVIIGYLLEVGGRKFFIQASKGDVDMNYLKMGFDENRYMNIIFTMFKKSVLIFLWSLLLVIPGIIKSYEYRMIPYLLAENPNMNPDRAFEISKMMTDGEKFEIFVLDLSFIGWYMLGALFFGLGGFFVNPYVDTTNAELYDILKSDLIEKNIISRNELTTN